MMIYGIWFLNRLLVLFIFALCVYKFPIPILYWHYVFYLDITQLHLNSTVHMSHPLGWCVVTNDWRMCELLFSQSQFVSRVGCVAKTGFTSGTSEHSNPLSWSYFRRTNKNCLNPLKYWDQRTCGGKSSSLLLYYVMSRIPQHCAHIVTE